MERIRRLLKRQILILLPGLLLLGSGCATRRPGGRPVGPTALQQATQPFSPEERLNVGIEIFDPGDLSETNLKEEHSNAEIRKAETFFMPVHLKNTLDRSNYWGEVRVVPPGSKGLDLLVHTSILHSNGERLTLRVRAEDSQGYLWLSRIYTETARKQTYTESVRGSIDPFQNIYNAIANDLAAVRRRMDAFEVKTLRRTTEMAFAAELVPAAFSDYVQVHPDGRREVVRLPAENDPTWLRVEQIATRNELFYDALHQTFDPFYLRMWPSYQEWRSYNLVEQTAIREAKRDSLKQAAAGIIMIATAILLEVYDVERSSTLRDVLVLGGAQVLINGVNISARTEIHEETLKELADSFGTEARTVTVQLEGQTVTLTGSVEQQLQQWRELLRKLHEAENAPMDQP